MYQLLSDKYDYGFRSHQGCILHVAANKNGIAFSSRDFFHGFTSLCLLLIWNYWKTVTELPFEGAAALLNNLFLLTM